MGSTNDPNTTSDLSKIAADLRALADEGAKEQPEVAMYVLIPIFIALALIACWTDIALMRCGPGAFMRMCRLVFMREPPHIS